MHNLGALGEKENEKKKMEREIKYDILIIW